MLVLNDFTEIFADNYDNVHIDEKWFNLRTTNDSYWKTKNEDTALRTSKSKRFYLKILLLFKKKPSKRCLLRMFIPQHQERSVYKFVAAKRPKKFVFSLKMLVNIYHQPKIFH